MKVSADTLGRLAQNFILNGVWESEAVAELDEEQVEILFDHLASRAEIETAATGLDEGSIEHTELDVQILELESFYLGQLSRASSAKPDATARLQKAATWLAIEPVLLDRDFLVRLAQRRFHGLKGRCARDLADLLGVSARVLSDFFAGPAGEGLARAENKSSVKPRDDGTEDFSKALERSSLPEIFKRRWREG